MKVGLFFKGRNGACSLCKELEVLKLSCSKETFVPLEVEGGMALCLETEHEVECFGAVGARLHMARRALRLSYVCGAADPVVVAIQPDGTLLTEMDYIQKIEPFARMWCEGAEPHTTWCDPATWTVPEGRHPGAQSCPQF